MYGERREGTSHGKSGLSPGEAGARTETGARGWIRSKLRSSAAAAGPGPGPGAVTGSGGRPRRGVGARARAGAGAPPSGMHCPVPGCPVHGCGAH